MFWLSVNNEKLKSKATNLNSAEWHKLNYKLDKVFSCDQPLYLEGQETFKFMSLKLYETLTMKK